MKNLKLLALSFVGATLLATGMISCSNDEVDNPLQENTEQMPMQSKSALLSSEDGYLYAEAFYGADISLGSSIQLIVDDESIAVTVSEVIVSDDTRARGYIVDDISSGDFLYFVDVDRESDVLTTYEVSGTIQEIFDDLLEYEDYLLTDKFDFIEYSEQYMIATADCNFGKKLWGKCTTYGNPTYLGNGLCGQSSTTTTYRLGLVTKRDPNYDTYPC